MSPRPGADAARVHKWFVRLAVASAALMFVVIVASAYLRHWQAGLACPDWPACYGRVDVEAVAAPPLPVRAARLAHRLAWRYARSLERRCPAEFGQGTSRRGRE